MLYGFLMMLFIFICVLLIIIILVQQGKGGLGLGALGGSAQMLFGGSGGQEIFQKITWTLGAVFMLGSLLLFLMKSSELGTSRYIGRNSIMRKKPIEADIPDQEKRKAIETQGS